MKESKESFKQRLKRAMEEHRSLLDDPRMADDYNPETGKRDGVPYWERKAQPNESDSGR